MIISEKQIMALIGHAYDYRQMLIDIKNSEMITETGKSNLSNVCALLTSIFNQQSDKLKEIE